MLSPKSWAVRALDGQKHESEIENLSPLLLAYLKSRGIAASEYSGFLNPKLDQLRSPFLIKNLEKSVLRIADAIQNQECIAIYGDYDIDGSSGLTTLETFFKACGLRRSICFQPDRFKDGYGVHDYALRNLVEQGATLIVTVDTGITAIEAAREAKKLGVDLIISDHHAALTEMPETEYIVNPNQPGDDSDMGHLCGTGVAFYLCLGLRAELRKRGHFSGTNILEPDLRKWTDLFAIATVADCVPLIKENRILTKFGLENLLTSQRPGLSALFTKAFAKLESHPSARDISFQLAPKLNAASRMGHQQLTQSLLLSESREEAEILVDKILSLNSQRSRIQDDISTQAKNLAKEKLAQQNLDVLVLCGEWFEGVLGIVAAKVSEEFGKPSILLGKLEDGTYRGSMRSSMPGFHCVKALEMSQDLLVRFGGHAQAAGLQIAADKLLEFEKRINETTIAMKLSGDTHLEILEETLFFDGVLPDKVHLEDCLFLEKTAPWGIGNPPPLFLAPQIPLDTAIPLKESHLKWVLKSGPLMGFFKKKEIDALRNEGFTHFDALVTPQVNRFRGSASVQFILEHVRGTRI